MMIHFASAFIVYNMPLMAQVGLPIVSYWCFSDVFEEGGFMSVPFHEGFGLLTVNQIAKPAFNAFKLLHRTGSERVRVVPDYSTFDNTVNIGVWAVKNTPRNELMIFLFNHNIPGTKIVNETITFVVNGAKSVNGVIEVIDDSHTNPKAVWESMGSPEYLTQNQINGLKAAAQLIPNPISGTKLSSNEVKFVVDLIPQGIAVVTVPTVA